MLAADFSKLGTVVSCHFGMMTGIPLTGPGSNNNETGDGTEDITLFDLKSDFTWDLWMDAAKQTGAKSVFMTTRHVDGTANWPTQSPYGKSIQTTSWWIGGRHYDLVKEFCDAARARGLGVGMYYAVGDNFAFGPTGGDYGALYQAHLIQQLTELLTNYGQIDYIFLDAWGTTWSPLDFDAIAKATLYDTVKTLQPGCLVGINDHDNSGSDARSGDFLIYECPHDSEPRSKIATDSPKPILLHAPIQYTDFSKWFNHSDSSVEEPEIPARISKLRQHRTVRNGFVMAHNFSPDYHGKLDTTTKNILKVMESTTVPALWAGTALYYKFDALSGGETAQGISYSTSTQDRTSMVQTGTVGSTNGKKGNARVFDTGKHFTSDDSTTYTPVRIGSRSHSWVGWCNPTSLGAATLLFGKDANTGGTSYVAGIEGNKPFYRTSPDGTALSTVTSTTAITAGTPFHFVFTYTYDSVQPIITVQVNGGTIVSGNGSNISDNGTTFFFGTRGGDDFPLTGWLDDVVLLLDRVVTQAEGTAMYNSGKGLSPLNTPSTIDTKSDLVLWYKMDSSTAAKDYSGNGYDGLAFGFAPSDVVPGKVATALKFSSSSNSVDTSTDQPVFSDTPLTVTQWVNIDTLVDLTTFAERADDNSPFHGWYLRAGGGDGSALNAIISVNGSFAPTASGPSALVTGKWLLIGFVADGATVTAYINGVPGTPQTAVGVIDNINTQVTFGNDSLATTRFVHGTVDDSRIYNRALTTMEMLALYRQGARIRQNNGIDLPGPSMIS